MTWFVIGVLTGVGVVYLAAVVRAFVDRIRYGRREGGR